MDITNTLLDNSENLKMADTLRKCIADKDINIIRIATGYWDIPGMALLKNELKEFLEREGTVLKLLIGKDPYVYANMVKEPKYATKHYPDGFIRTGIDELADNLLDEYKESLNLLLDHCKGDNPKFQIHTYKKEEDDNVQFMHSKCYIFTSSDLRSKPTCAIVGSSNFTKKGLEGNAELNYVETNAYVVLQPDVPEIKGHVTWFEEKWQQSDDWTKEFLEQVLLTSKPVQKMEIEKHAVDKEDQDPLTPYELYIKLLHYNFGDMIDVDTTKVISNYLPKKYSPLEYQLDAVKQCFSTMKAHGGFMLADVVGLGKTIVGTLVIKYFLNYPDDGRERKVLIVTPPAIKSAWEDTIMEFDKESDNVISPYIDFITTGSIGNLVDNPDVDEDEEIGDFDGDLANKNYGLIIIDESHKFRNSDTDMYRSLDNLIAQIGSNTGLYPYIGLLSATPQNNTPNDLKNQIYLFERNHQYCTLDKVDGRNLEAFFSRTMHSFSALRKEASEISAKEIKTQEDKDRQKAIDQELGILSAEIRDHVLCDILVRRTRTDIKKYYEEDMTRQQLVFPEISGPHGLEYKMDKWLINLFNTTMDIIVPSEEYKMTSDRYLSYYRYRTIEFLTDENTRKKYAGRGARDAKAVSAQLARIMQILLVKRLESSFSAFKESLSNLQKYTENMIRMWENNTIFICPGINVNEELNEEVKTLKRGKKVTFDDCVNDIREKIKKLDENGRNEKRQNAEYTRDDFNAEYINLLKSDYKYIKWLCDQWAKNSEDPKFDAFKENLRPVLFNPTTNRPQKLVIFSEAIDTVESLTRACENKGFSTLAITAANRKEMEQTIRENFDANYRGEWKNDYQIIITTEVLAEGINLHRANCILNYDTPWNSTRLMQRIGRVNRIGSQEPVVYVYNFMPSAEGDLQIQLVEKAHIKLQSFHTLFGEDSKIFTKKEIVSHYDLQKMTDGEESPYEKYLYELKSYRDNNPERFEFIINEENDLEMAVATEDGCSYFVVRTPRMKGLFVMVDAEGKGQVISGMDMYSRFKCLEDVSRTDLPADWEARKKTAVRTLGQHLNKITSYQSKSEAATSARGTLIKLDQIVKRKETKTTLEMAMRLVRSGNIDIIRTINAIGAEVFSTENKLFAVGESDIDEIINKRLDNIVSELGARSGGTPSVYIGLSK